ncbi:ParA family protein, partial [Mycobacteroides abscessus]
MSPQVYSFQNQKGGSGKSTAAINFAGEMALRGKRVLFIDTDPQGTALD